MLAAPSLKLDDTNNFHPRPRSPRKWEPFFLHRCKKHRSSLRSLRCGEADQLQPSTRRSPARLLLATPLRCSMAVTKKDTEGMNCLRGFQPWTSSPFCMRKAENSSSSLLSRRPRRRQMASLSGSQMLSLMRPLLGLPLHHRLRRQLREAQPQHWERMVMFVRLARCRHRICESQLDSRLRYTSLFLRNQPWCQPVP